MIYLVTWSYVLYSLFFRFKSSEHLLPRKRVFIIHAVLLAVYLFCYIITIVINRITEIGNCGATYFDISASIHNIVGILQDACEVTTFAYVVYS